MMPLAALLEGCTAYCLAQHNGRWTEEAYRLQMRTSSGYRQE